MESVARSLAGRRSTINPRPIVADSGPIAPSGGEETRRRASDSSTRTKDRRMPTAVPRITKTTTFYSTPSCPTRAVCRELGCRDSDQVRLLHDGMRMSVIMRQDSAVTGLLEGLFRTSCSRLAADVGSCVTTEARCRGVIQSKHRRLSSAVENALAVVEYSEMYDLAATYLDI